MQLPQVSNYRDTEIQRLGRLCGAGFEWIVPQASDQLILDYP
jgi:hypothetical protein